MKSYRIFLTFLILFNFNDRLQGQAEVSDIEDLLLQFESMDFKDPYKLSDHSSNNKIRQIQAEDVNHFFRHKLKSNEYCYPVGRYEYENFHCLRIQIVFYAKPKIVNEYLISLSKEGKFIDKLLCGTYSADVAGTYRMISNLNETEITTIYTVTTHKFINDDNSTDAKAIHKKYRISPSGDFCFIEDDQ